MMDTRMYVCTHKAFDVPADGLYIPLHVGRKISEDLGFVGDDTGDSISDKNRQFCELTGMYWIWKNVDCDIVGLCHYRRYMQRDGKLLERGYIEHLLSDEGYDIIIPASGSSEYSNNLEHYDRVHFLNDLMVTKDVLLDKYPEYAGAFDLFCSTNLASLANMVITRKEIFDEYCEWLFDILFEVEKRTDVSGYDTFQARLYGYLSERLFRIWLFMHSYHVREEQVLLTENINLHQQVQMLADIENKMDKVTVIIPCYNREKYIAECVDSLIGQTYPGEYLELIFIDDGSSDATVEILKTYEAKYPEEILIVELPENSGCPGNVRNIGMQYATGDYLMFVDSDDVVNRCIIEKMHKLAVESSADIVSANMQMFSGDSVLMTEGKDDRIFDTSDAQSLVDLLGSEGRDGHIGARLYRMNFLRDNDICFPVDRHVSEDTFFNMSCLLMLKKYCRTSEVLYYYRNNADGLWRSDSQPPEQILECLKTQEELMPLYEARIMPLMPDIVGWFFFNALSVARLRLLDMGQSDFYEKELPSIRERLRLCVPDLETNSLVKSLSDDASLALYKDLFE